MQSSEADESLALMNLQLVGEGLEEEGEHESAKRLYA